MSKIWKAVKTAWIYNLAILLVGIILVGGEIKTVNSKHPPAGGNNNQQTIDSKQLTDNSQQEAINNQQITINNKSLDSTANNNNQTTNTKNKSQVVQKTTIENVVVPTPEQPTQVLDAKKAEVVALPSAQMTIDGLGSYQTNIATDETAFTLLIKIAAQNNFKVIYKLYSFGAFITSMGGINPADNEFWALYYNDQSSSVGASQLKLNDGDKINWRIEKW